MLTRLTVSNFAIISYSEVDFSPNFNVITGETGAGKSILLDALSLILGNRADLSVLADKSKKCVIEAVFHVNDTHRDFFVSNELDFEPEAIIRRELSPSGKSRAFINDTPVTLNLLKELTTQLVDLHQQQDSRSVAESDFQRQLVDVFAKSTKQALAFNQKYVELQGFKKKLSQLMTEQSEKQQQQDFLRFQLEELQQADIKAGELDSYELQLKIATNAEAIAALQSSITQLLDDDENNATVMLQQALADLKKLSRLNENFEKDSKRLESIVIELEDFTKDFSLSTNHDVVDEDNLTFLQDRINLLNRLMSKHQRNDEGELLALQDEMSNELDSLEFVKDEISLTQEKIALLEETLQNEAESISALRKKIVPELSNEVKNLLAQVGMNNAEFIIDIKGEALNAYGKDEIQFLFNANKGTQAKPIKQIASGGELSRLMLALKSVVAGKSTLPTLIFDEIDTGISGEVAKKVGSVMYQLGGHHQVIAITHSPQVAAKGNVHFKIFKEDNDTATVSSVTRLLNDQRINEIAEMLGGANPSKSSLSAAKELMN